MIKRINPQQAWEQLQNNEQAVLIDVRTSAEYHYVGHPTMAVFIPWKELPAMDVNPDFLAQVANAVPDKQAPLILMCRSGQRSMQAAQALEDAGYTDVSNMEEGFEGDKDNNQQRSNLNGWRFHQLPWKQS
ncbi:MAG: rhodanese-like domain-containing protein [Gammaproteobacteria bacterium]|nr:rhodanese-like domain-containing protein [Gammaproteobacteria bacterium]